MKSKLGVGTKFDIHLPALTEGYVDQKNRKEPQLQQNEGRILIMDDQEEIREITVCALTNLGYDVATSADGEGAIEKITEAKAAGIQFSAVILDLIIPGKMGGKETTKQLLRIEPNIVAVVASGYSDDQVMTDYEAYGLKAAIAKPYTIAELAKVLLTILNKNQRT